MAAGGMRRRSSGSLADRVAATTATPAAPATAATAASAPPPPGLKHCWVTGPSGRLPGLLLGWRQGAEGWQGRVVHPVPDPAGWVVVEEWLPAGALEPT